MGLSKLHLVKTEDFLANYWREILNASGAIECIVDNKGIIRFVTMDFCRLFDLYYKEIDGQYLSDFIDDGLVRMSLRKQVGGQGYVTYRRKKCLVKTLPIISDEGFRGLRIIYEPYGLEHTVSIERLPSCDHPYPQIKGQNIHLLQSLQRAEKIAKRQVSVMIRGESGTGKGLLAQAIHEDSLRRQGPYICINCAAIPENLIESELFGHEIGAFTGAVKTSVGLFEMAHGGTLFLDEIGDLSYSLQVKLLKVLQDRAIRRIGGRKDIPVDVRIITATHRNLEQMIQDKLFREDLYYRLNVIELDLPSLRDRMDDLDILCQGMMKELSVCHGLENKRISTEALEAMKSYDWPGNVRQLRNVLEQAILLSEGNQIQVFDLPKQVSKYYDFSRNPGNGQLINVKSDGTLAKLEEYEGEIVALAMERFGSFTAAGRALGLTHKTVAAKYRKYLNDR